MPWAKLDDGFYDHTKVDLLAETPGRPPASWKLDGVGLYVLAISWCSRQLTNGRINLRQLARLADLPPVQTRRVADALVKVRLLDVVDEAVDTYDIHDY